tara:strand:- start:960 stop:1343 length:384 start_codon:yes stop_codon:yes gene_type:complete
VSLVARYLEENKIPTIIVGSALDIVEHCGVPRFLYTDFPLGNPCGRPFDESMQLSIIKEAIALLESAGKANTTSRSKFTWSEDNAWRDDYAEVNAENEGELARRGEDRRRQQALEKSAGTERSPMIS